MRPGLCPNTWSTYSTCHYVGIVIIQREAGQKSEFLSENEQTHCVFIIIYCLNLFMLHIDNIEHIQIRQTHI